MYHTNESEQSKVFFLGSYIEYFIIICVGFVVTQINFSSLVFFSFVRGLPESLHFFSQPILYQFVNFSTRFFQAG